VEFFTVTNHTEFGSDLLATWSPSMLTKAISWCHIPTASTELDYSPGGMVSRWSSSVQNFADLAYHWNWRYNCRKHGQHTCETIWSCILCTDWRHSISSFHFTVFAPQNLLSGPNALISSRWVYLLLGGQTRGAWVIASTFGATLLTQHLQ